MNARESKIKFNFISTQHIKFFVPAGADPQGRGADRRVHADDGHEVEGGEEEELLEVGGGHAEGHALVSQDDQLVHAEGYEGEQHVDGEVASQPLRVVVEELWERGEHDQMVKRTGPIMCVRQNHRQ